MQRPVRGYRGGIRVGSYLTHTHLIKDNDIDDNSNNNNNNVLSLSNSSSDELEDDNNENESTLKSKNSSILTSMIVNDDNELSNQNFHLLKTRKRKNKINTNISGQKADLPQLNMITDKTNNPNEQIKEQQAKHWFPKPDIGNVDPNDFIRHNHVESQQINEESTPPALLTTVPPVDVSTRPTAIVAPAGPTRSISAFFTSTSSIKKATNNNIYNIQNSSTINSIPRPGTSSLFQTASSAFQPIQNLSSNNINNRSMPMDIPKHKPLERGQNLTHVHISHPQSPATVHLMLREDFNAACRLLHKMAARPEFQSNYIPSQPFKPEINGICACFHEGRWFRCRILQIAPDLLSATVIYLDWGMIIPVEIQPKYIRQLPKEFSTDPSCSIMCHLDGVPEPNDSVSSNIIAQCINLLSENEYDVIVNDYHSKTGGKIILLNNGRNINEQIKQILLSQNVQTPEQELIEQFQYQLKLSVGDESKALLSSFGGKDDSFYVLIINENTVAIDRAMSQLEEDHIPNREYIQIPQLKTLVVARYAGDRKCYRAWVKAVDLKKEQAIVFFVDFGNESKVSFNDIYICPESVRTLPWLGVRVRLTTEKMTVEELTKFWKLTESHYIWIRVHEILNDSYGINIKIDFSVYLRQERLKMFTSKQLVNKSVQTKFNDKSLSNVETNVNLLTPSIFDQQQIGTNENSLRNLFEIINNELRLLRHRINDSDDASQDRHTQLMQLLFPLFNTNNSNYSKKEFK